MGSASGNYCLSGAEKSLIAKGRLDLIPPYLWERLCDGCAQCCLHKLYDPANGTFYLTMIACRYLDLESCSCTIYSERHQLVKNCLVITPETISQIGWLPDTCAYKLIFNGHGLPPWHPLLNGNRDLVHRKGISIKNYAISPKGIPPSDYSYYIINIMKGNSSASKLIFKDR